MKLYSIPFKGQDGQTYELRVAATDEELQQLHSAGLAPQDPDEIVDVIPAALANKPGSEDHSQQPEEPLGY